MRASRTGRHLDRSLRLRVRIYLLVFAVALVLVVVDVSRIGAVAVVPVVLAGLAGVVVGAAASRMFALSWDRVSGRVVGRIDAVGAVVLVLYVALMLVRDRVLGLWIDAPVVGVAGLAVLAGLMLGQVVATGRGAQRLVRLAGAGAD